ncbi:MAG: hypothetical protein JST00_43165 [Deltaproteobacteria bacterium]|nr:hypothetical protein [Deltaproteobacteria bacterium]
MLRRASKRSLANLGLVAASLLGCVSGCGGEGVTPPVVPQRPVIAPEGPPKAVDPTPAKTPVPPADPWALPEGPRDDDPVSPPAPALRLDDWERARKAKGIAAAPASCAQAKKPAATAKPEEVARAADLAPVECADGITDALLERRGAATGEVLHVLVGLSLASKLSRTAGAPPVMGAIKEKEKVKAFIAGPLKTWVVEQATAIETLASGAAGLAGYGRGIAAIEAGIAELRLVDKIRSAPVPATWDPELKAVYEAALDDALEPRKRRGRDAALVGMSDFAQIGVIRDARIERARTLLSKLYGGRRIDALEALLVPQQGPVARAPAIHWPDLTANDATKDPNILVRAIPQGVRAKMRATPDAALLSPYARGRLDMGRVYWRRMDFVEAAHAAKASSAPEDRLVLAVALALAHAPNGAAAMMAAPSPSALDLSHTEALDALATDPKTPPALAGMAAFDAAHLRSLSPPEGADAVTHLRDVATRFEKAEALLLDPLHKKKAAERAAEAKSIAAAAEKKK